MIAPEASLSEYHCFCFVSIIYINKKILAGRAQYYPVGFEDPQEYQILEKYHWQKSKRKIAVKPGSNWIPCIPCCSLDDAISFMKEENSMWLSVQPCLSPTRQSKNSVSLSSILTHNITDLYIYGNKKPLKLFRQTIWGKNVKVHVEQNQRPSLDPQSMYTLYHLFSIGFFSTIALHVKMWLVVEYPCLHSACAYDNLSFSSAHETSLWFSTKV